MSEEEGRRSLISLFCGSKGISYLLFCFFFIFYFLCFFWAAARDRGGANYGGYGMVYSFTLGIYAFLGCVPNHGFLPYTSPRL